MVGANVFGVLCTARYLVIEADDVSSDDEYRGIAWCTWDVIRFSPCELITPCVGLIRLKPSTTWLGVGRSVLQGYDNEEDQHDQHDDAAQRELADLAPQGPNLRATGPNA